MRGMPSAYALLMLRSRGPAGGLIDRYATACEAIAYVAHTICICSANSCSRTDAAFAAAFGDEFHRAVSTAYVRHMLRILSSQILPYITIYYIYLFSRPTLLLKPSICGAHFQAMLSFPPMWNPSKKPVRLLFVLRFQLKNRQPSSCSAYANSIPAYS